MSVMEEIYGNTMDQPKRDCKWIHDGDYKIYKTQCGEVMKFELPRPAANGFNFCPFCGLEIYAVRTEAPALACNSKK